ncbi:Alpha/Beta hydrolase protein [Dactylonectria macrodidyma]|uniref:Alpha/Beta hydrolase protein n=1 Tax=Dactylonectria macrodidyma TaxID=307937 RepID=A0A9P9IZ04_9HYPO|nr:Alpha/Beta hydrolase protein [Dactylonectria macrodidyma]
MHLKPEPEDIDINAPSKPLQKYGHLSQKIPEFVAAESAIIVGYSKLRACPDFPAVREAAGDPDAPLPPGGPVRGRDVVSELVEFPARDGTLIELKVYKSPSVVQDATLMYRMHGGGWSVGRREVDGAENVFAAANPNIVVVTTNIAGAPEHPFPQPLHDSYWVNIFWYCKKNARALGVNPEKIILSGSSAGANLSFTSPPVCHPIFFPREKYEFSSYIQNSDNCVLSTLMMEAALDAYMPHPEPDSRHSPLLADSLEGLSSALIQCAGDDILRDDAFAYAEALQTAGVEVEVYGFAGVPHCFPAILLNISETAIFYERYNRFLEKHAK